MLETVLHLSLSIYFSLSSLPFCQVVKLCRECLEKQTVLADTHLYQLRVLSVASEVLSYMRCFSEAAEYARRMVEGYM